MNLEIYNIDGAQVCVGGIGELFFKQGIPIGITVSELSKKGIVTSIYNLADELLKHGWSAKTTCAKIVSELNDSGIILNNTDNLMDFCLSTYEQQRETIKSSLFKTYEIANDFRNQLLKKYMNNMRDEVLNGKPGDNPSHHKVFNNESIINKLNYEKNN